MKLDGHKKKRRTVHTFVKPQNYYNHLLTFFFVVAFVLTITLTLRFGFGSLENFLLQFFILLFLLLAIAVIVEFSYSGEYMHPFEVYDVQAFTYNFIKDVSKNKPLTKYFNKYDAKTKKKNLYLFKSNKILVLSSIRKHGNTYEVTLLDEHKVVRFFLIRFFLGRVIYKLYVRKVHDKYKIIRLS